MKLTIKKKNIINIILIILLTLFCLFIIIPNIFYIPFSKSFKNYNLTTLLKINHLNLGLDLLGGTHFLIKIDTKTNNNKSTLVSVIKKTKNYLQKKNIKHIKIEKKKNDVIISLFKKKHTKKLMTFLKKMYTEEFHITEKKNFNTIHISNKNYSNINKKGKLIKQTITILKNRINILGITDYIIQAQSINKINIELPGMQNLKKVKKILKKTATLEFVFVKDIITKKKKFNKKNL